MFLFIWSHKVRHQLALKCWYHFNSLSRPVAKNSDKKRSGLNSGANTVLLYFHCNAKSHFVRGAHWRAASGNCGDNKIVYGLSVDQTSQNAIAFIWLAFLWLCKPSCDGPSILMLHSSVAYALNTCHRVGEFFPGWTFRALCRAVSPLTFIKVWRRRNSLVAVFWF